ncbi:MULTISPECIES: dihydropteroate synthase [Flavobacterium]|uniref:Dihydropteroate synthase n=2 Tax=Flavobacterium TaxID=237 RepID=A0AA94F4I6_9FLAO|nr:MULTISPECIES: dihydropteroate synthase [Flavobacterium]OXA83978.1 dihydropteroate synthase [Flavobacterium columnare] [Flavobacterium columnare NBRC 100251 = ATCC 23463]AMA48437.1 dihydropteroate synthase [Flavobacterium covae]AND65433.1 dihydropteroate synthase [Flavobacterium covae]MCH4830366.1 dihydropteroate synthase [Flavobacterium columnare]MCH4833698.1 dihydropteroate synthase [Flavobacterium columnare]
MQMTTINCKGKLIDLMIPRVMGILNITPDSFYDGGKLKTDVSVLKQAEKMLLDGATFLDIGGQSTRPNAQFLSADEELGRIEAIVSLLITKFPEVLLSIDTFHSKVADECLQIGASLINDISAGELDENMFRIIAKHNIPFIMMHLRGTPKTMQKMVDYDDLLKEILFYFSGKIEKARSYGINDLILDPGFGFSKTLEQNFELLSKMELLSIAELPILVGMSRKSMIYKTLDITVQEALNGTTVLNTIAITKGASILRVHDVKEAVEAIRLCQMI